MDPALEEKLRDALLRTFFAGQLPEHFDTELGRKELSDHVSVRYEECCELVVPWVESRRALAGAEIVEIGCGTGSSTAAFAARADHVYAYDMNARSLSAAAERLRIMGLDNATFAHVEPSDGLESARRTHPDGADVILLYAVLEHQTVQERLETIRRSWEMLRPGGLLVVADTPNRLVYRHYHTSDIPFFDMLPHELAWTQIDKSPRANFREGMKAALEKGPARAEEVLARWGTGVSHHEFEAALGDLGPLVVGDGFDAEILSRKPIVLEEELLLSFFVLTELPVPVGFARVSLDVILRKPGGSARDTRFESAGLERARSIAVRDGELSRVLSAYFLQGDAPRLGLEEARNLADRSLNGTTLLRLAARKLWHKLSGRVER